MYNPQLETFITVAESGSFAKAADKLYISPTAVIKQINILESNLDIKLFNRTHRGLTLTAAGKSLYSDARYIIRYSHESLERAKNAMQKENGIIRIGTSPMTPAQILWYSCGPKSTPCAPKYILSWCRLTTRRKTHAKYC